MFILFQKYRFVYRKEGNSPPIRQFPSFSIFGHVTIIKRQGTRKPQDLLLGKSSFCSRSPSERYCQYIICLEHKLSSLSNISCSLHAKHEAHLPVAFTNGGLDRVSVRV